MLGCQLLSSVDNSRKARGLQLLSSVDSPHRMEMAAAIFIRQAAQGWGGSRYLQSFAQDQGLQLISSVNDP